MEKSGKPSVRGKITDNLRLERSHRNGRALANRHSIKPPSQLIPKKYNGIERDIQTGTNEWKTYQGRIVRIIEKESSKASNKKQTQ